MAHVGTGPSRFIRKLQHVLPLSTDDRRALRALEASCQSIPRQTDLVVQEQPYRATYILQAGWAIRYKTLPDGQRQVLTVLLPGDCIGLTAPLLTLASAAVSTVTPATVTEIPPERLLETFRVHPILGAALHWNLAQEEAVIAEHLVNVGRRSAYARLGHFFLELFWRLDSVGLVRQRAYDFPLTQAILADALGLSLVHVNRSLQRLRREGLVELMPSRVAIPNPRALATATAFEKGYLHLVEAPIWFRRYIARTRRRASRSSTV